MLRDVEKIKINGKEFNISCRSYAMIRDFDEFMKTARPETLNILALCQALENYVKRSNGFIKPILYCKYRRYLIPIKHKRAIINLSNDLSANEFKDALIKLAKLEGKEIKENNSEENKKKVKTQ